MNNLKCCIARDLLPLYIDDVLSQETTQDLRNHLKSCESCRNEHLALTKELQIPSNSIIQEGNSRALKKFKKKWTRKNITITVLSVLLFLFAFFPVRDAIAESELFQPCTTARAGTVGQLYLGDLSDGEQWTRLYFGKADLFSNAYTWWNPYLVFDNIFYEKEAINSANSSTAVEMRILDVDENIVIKPFVIEPGMAVSLDQLESGVPYIVEYRADGDFYIFNFT